VPKKDCTHEAKNQNGNKIQKQPDIMAASRMKNGAAYKAD